MNDQVIDHHAMKKKKDSKTNHIFLKQNELDSIWIWF